MLLAAAAFRSARVAARAGEGYDIVMRLDDLSADGRHPLTYCSNVHPAQNLEDAEEVLRQSVAPTLRASLGDAALCAGLWWPRDVVRDLQDPARLRCHRDLLLELGLVPLSLNVFPMGRFHDAGVKAAVYDPDWSSEERLAYTLAAGRCLADLLRDSAHGAGVLSTVPLGFRGENRDRRPGPEHLRNVFRLACTWEKVREETGVWLTLAIEPEPWCLLESIDEMLRWWVDEALPFAAQQGNEAALRRHVGLCLDLCHAAVVGEDPLEALDLCLQSGLRIGKVQLSSAPVATDRDSLRALIAWDEPVYLHQTWAREAAVGEHSTLPGPWLDLADPELARHAGDALANEGAATGIEYVSHFHVPLHWAGENGLCSTQNEVSAFLDTVRDGALPEGTPLEVETYTNPKIAEEVAWAVERLIRP